MLMGQRRRRAMANRDTLPEQDGTGGERPRGRGKDQERAGRAAPDDEPCAEEDFEQPESKAGSIPPAPGVGPYPGTADEVGQPSNGDQQADKEERLRLGRRLLQGECSYEERAPGGNPEDAGDNRHATRADSPQLAVERQGEDPPGQPVQAHESRERLARALALEQ
jgi:hypothetical protein